MRARSPRSRSSRRFSSPAASAAAPTRCRAMSRGPMSTSRRRPPAASSSWPVDGGAPVAEGDAPLPPRRFRPEGGGRRRRGAARPGRGAARQSPLRQAAEEIGVLEAQLSEARGRASNSAERRLPAPARAPREAAWSPSRRSTTPRRRRDTAQAQRRRAPSASSTSPKLPARPERDRSPPSGTSPAQQAALAQAEDRARPAHAQGAGERPRRGDLLRAGRTRHRRPAGRLAPPRRQQEGRASSCPSRASPASRSATRSRSPATAAPRASRRKITFVATEAEFTPPVIYSQGRPREARLPRRGAAARRGGAAQGRPAGRRDAARRRSAGHERRAGHRHRGPDQELQRQGGGRPCRPQRQPRRDRRLPRPERLGQDHDHPHDLRAAQARRRHAAPASATTS